MNATPPSRSAVSNHPTAAPPHRPLTTGHCRTLLNHALLAARAQVRRRRWRGSPHGILPDGFDPDAIASEALVEFLQS